MNIKNINTISMHGEKFYHRIAFSDFKIFVYLLEQITILLKASLIHRKQAPLLLDLCDEGAGLVAVVYWNLSLVIEKNINFPY